MLNVFVGLWSNDILIGISKLLVLFIIGWVIMWVKYLDWLRFLLKLVSVDEEYVLFVLNGFSCLMMVFVLLLLINFSFLNWYWGLFCVIKSMFVCFLLCIRLRCVVC